jgi:hypothetical protein
MGFNSGFKGLKENYDICFETFMLWTTVLFTPLLEVHPKTTNNSSQNLSSSFENKTHGTDKQRFPIVCSFYPFM